MSKPVSIALCMIVKNAEKTLKECLISAERAAFHEYVIVDTGSTDKTCDIVRDFASNLPHVEESQPYVHLSSDFHWADDFAEARNISFDRAESQWRMFLDADDVLVNGAFLRGKLEDLLERHPSLNAVSMVYDYAEGETSHEKIRLVKWLDDDGKPLGWQWTDPVHEFLDLPGKQKVVATLLNGHEHDIYVKHAKKTHAELVASAERNKRILDAARNDVRRSNDQYARLTFHLAHMLKHDDPRRAISLFREVATEHDTSFAAYAYIEQARIHIAQKNYKEARAVASEGLSHMPEFTLAQHVIGYSFAMQGDQPRAALAFDVAYTPRKLSANLPVPYEDVFFEKCEMPAYAARAFAVTGDHERALEILNSIPAELRFAASGRALYVLRETHAFAMQMKGLQRVVDMVDYFIWDTEPLKALTFLNECVPMALQTLPAIENLKRKINDKLGHLASWDAYKEHYASIPAETYHTADEHRENTLRLARAQNVIKWAEQKGAEGKRPHVLAIGAQDCDIESEMMRLCPGMRVTVCDVAPQASKGIQALREKYGDRVSVWAMSEDHYDWRPPHETYDAVVMFEVIEHLPSAQMAFQKLHSALTPGGSLFLSCPIARRWVEPYLTGPNGPDWYGHVRAYDYNELHDAVAFSDFSIVRMHEEFDGTFFVEAKREYEEDFVQRGEVVIVVPGTPSPFNARSHETGFVGGSEEAVIHLSRALARQDFFVRVFAPVPEQYPIVRVQDGVIWAPIEEYTEKGLGSNTTVIYWRAPLLVPEESKVFKKVLWLHDACYDVTDEVYRRADDVLVLSESHARSLRERDGLSRDVVQVRNGIDAKAFTSLESGKRDVKKVIYASSPDRGLKTLLRSWHIVTSQVPDATLDIYYDWTVFRQKKPAEARELDALLAEAGPSVTLKGGVSHEVLHRAFKEAGIWAYPNFGDVETSCITAMKVMAAGCYPVVFGAGALEETLGNYGISLSFDDAGHYEHPSFDDCMHFADHIAGETRDLTDVRRLMAVWAQEHYDWDAVAKDCFVPLLRRR